jgi:myo-inositol-1(or 4)-monophosphatase
LRPTSTFRSSGRQPVLGIVDAPLLGERFIAIKGAGAYGSGTKIAASEVDGLHEAIIGVADFKVGVGCEEENRVHLAALARLARRSLRVRMLGSAALDLAWLAAGRLNATLMLSNLPRGRDRRAVAGPRSGRSRVRPRRS